jgi:pyruvate carboxylase
VFLDAAPAELLVLTELVHNRQVGRPCPVPPTVEVAVADGDHVRHGDMVAHAVAGKLVTANGKEMELRVWRVLVEDDVESPEFLVEMVNAGHPGITTSDNMGSASISL